MGSMLINLLRCRRDRANLTQYNTETISSGTDDLVFRATPGTRILASDVNAREILWIETSALEQVLEGMLGDRLRDRYAR